MQKAKKLIKKIMNFFFFFLVKARVKILVETRHKKKRNLVRRFEKATYLPTC